MRLLNIYTLARVSLFGILPRLGATKIFATAVFEQQTMNHQSSTVEMGTITIIYSIANPHKDMCYEPSVQLQCREHTRNALPPTI